MTSYPQNQLRIFKFFCPAFIWPLYMLQLVTTSALTDSYPVCSLTHCPLCGNMTCYSLLKHFKSVDKAEGRTASTNSCNSNPSAPSICKFQAVHRCEGSATSCLLICGLLNGALESLECLKLVGLIEKGKL